MTRTNNLKVKFGKNGQFVEGEIVKYNSVKAKVRAAGPYRNRPAGTVWSVPYEMMETLDGKAVNSNGPVTDGSQRVTDPTATKKYIPDIFSQIEHNILNAIGSVYNSLSPENLSCDGEAPRSWVSKRYAQLNSQLRYLQLALGAQVTEEEVVQALVKFVQPEVPIRSKV